MKTELTCKQVAHLISSGMDADLPAHERARMRLHFVLCAACRNVDAQMGFLRQATRALKPPQGGK
jgi:predicted anti-sigma-YlaC factor YlaD